MHTNSHTQFKATPSFKDRHIYIQHFICINRQTRLCIHMMRKKDETFEIYIKILSSITMVYVVSQTSADLSKSRVLFKIRANAYPKYIKVF